MDKFLLSLGILTLAAYLIVAVVRPATAAAGLDATTDMFIQAVPWIIVSMFSAGLLAQYIDPMFVAKLLGRGSGIRGIILGALMGLFGTGSRWAVYPLVAGMIAADASPGAVFSFVTSWQLVSLSRLPAEVPFLGLRFTVLRAIVSLIIAITGGILVEWVESHRF